MKNCLRCNIEFNLNKINKKYIDKNPELYDLCSYCRKYKKCLNCNEEFNHTQNHTCSKNCAQELKEKSCMISCGTKHNFSKNSNSRKDWEDKLLDTEGIINVFQREEVKEKSKVTCLDKYGVEYYSMTEECKEKIKNTSIERYGVDNYQKTEECKEKIKITNLNKYGEEYYQSTEECKEKIKKTSIEKYGVYSIFLLKNFMETSMLNKYGTKYPSQLDFVKEKVKNTISTQEYKDKMIANGYYLDPQKMAEKELYYYLVDKETKKSLKEHGVKYFGENWKDKIGIKENHVDHIYSKIEGFNNGILPYIIGSIHNLRILPYMENCIKKDRCDITLEELIHNFIFS